MDKADGKPQNSRWEWERLKVPDYLLEHARTNRKISTEAERLLWSHLRNRNLENLKFRRQQPVRGFILDFYCDEIKLGIEVDGGIHSLQEREAYDRQRELIIQNLGIDIIRFTNEDVLLDVGKVLNTIKEEAGKRKGDKIKGGVGPSPPAPLPGERGVGEVDVRRVNSTKYFRFNGLLQSSGWLSPAFVGVDSLGNIQYLSDKAPEHAVAIEFVQGYALPGFQNAHSHAFQYAMAGRAETHQHGAADDFWSWREAMYTCALSMDPDQMQSVATMLYAEMLRSGYTHVAEFHYLHHDKNGKPYANLAEMGLRLVEAASVAGIKITLIPVFYQKGGFEKEPEQRQRRFISKTVDEYFNLLDDSADAIKDYSEANMGFSIHSLRAVDANDIIRTVNEGPESIPFHLHAAEQLKEVEDAVAFLKQRPVEWILNHLPVNDRFHLVHCTHMDDNEVKRLAKSGAHVVLCPGTEGNLGDGIFKLTDFACHGGSWSIGTDSQISLNPLGDLRWLDYAQRLTTHRRNTFDDGASLLIKKTISSGRKAMGLNRNEFFEIGQSLDAVVFNAKSPLLQSNTFNVLSGIVYTSDSSDISGTLVNGKWIVKAQRHVNEAQIKSKYVSAIKSLKF